MHLNELQSFTSGPITNNICYRRVVNKKRIRGVREATEWSINVRVASHPSLRINKDRLSSVLACNYDGTKPGIPWMGDPSCLARRRGSPLGRNQFGINVTSCGINVAESRRTETVRSLKLRRKKFTRTNASIKSRFIFYRVLHANTTVLPSRIYFFITLCTMRFL